MSSVPHQQIFRFYINVSQIFPWPANSPPSKEGTQTWGRSSDIASTVCHLPHDEQQRALQFYNIADASRCMGSYFLKHLAIMRGAGVPWSQSKITQERTIRNGKPFYAPGGLDFNVSHHGNFVVCVGSTSPGAKVGIDVVQVDVDKDQRRMGDRGFEGWVDNFADVLSSEERALAVDVARKQGIANGLRMFYTIWACKEAYIKMTSEALMAGYLKELAFPQLKVPDVPGGSDVWGQAVVTDVVVQGRSVEHARIEIVALRKDYIVATAVDQQGDLPPFEVVKISPDGLELECFADNANKLASRTHSLDA